MFVQEVLHLDIPNGEPLVYDLESRTLRLLLPGGVSRAWPEPPQPPLGGSNGLRARLSRILNLGREAGDAGREVVT